MVGLLLKCSTCKSLGPSVWGQEEPPSHIGVRWGDLVRGKLILVCDCKMQSDQKADLVQASSKADELTTPFKI